MADFLQIPLHCHTSTNKYKHICKHKTEILIVPTKYDRSYLVPCQICCPLFNLCNKLWFHLATIVAAWYNLIRSNINKK